MRLTVLGVALIALVLPVSAGALGPIGLGPSVDANHTVGVATCDNASGVCIYSPPVVVAAVGDTVTFNFSGCHTVTAGVASEAEPFDGPVPGWDAFDSGRLCAGAKFTITLGQQGVVKYYCATGTHAAQGMQGVIVVA